MCGFRKYLYPHPFGISNSLHGGVGVKDSRNSGRVGGVGQSVKFADLLWSNTCLAVLTCQVYMTKLVALIVAPELYYI